MKQLLPLLSILFLSLSVSAQKSGSVKGIVYEADKKQPLQAATATLLNAADSSNAAYAISDKDGAFELKNLAKGNYILGISTIGYKEFIRNITLADSSATVNVGAVYLQGDTSSQLNVIIKAPAIIIKKDTVEFKASAFPTKQNANVEDLLKKLPGVEVDKDGNITSQGEEITKIYVDGKEFFTNDPKLATKNLTAELVESIQVFDDMSDQAKFTKMDDGSRTRTINIKLKKDRRKGVFGRSNVAYGTKDRYQANLSANTFNEDRQISFVGGANNINRLGFTSNDIISNLGGMGGLGNGGGGGGNRGGGGGNRGGGGAGRGGGSLIQAATPDGNTASWNAGVNFRDQWGKKFQLAGNYFISKSVTTNRSTSNRQVTFPSDSITIANNTSFDRNSNLNNRVTLRAEYAFDSMNSILATPVISWQNSSSYSYDSTMTMSRVPDKTFLTINSLTSRQTNRDGSSFNNNLLYRHRFRTPGRTFTVGWTTGVNNTSSQGYVNSLNTFYSKGDGSVLSQRNQNQRNDQKTYSFNNTISTSFTELVTKTAVLELNYAFTRNWNTSDRKTYDYSLSSKQYDSLNKPLTNYFENLFISQRAGLNLRVKKEKYDWQLGGAVQWASLENMSHRATTGKDSMMKQNYVNFFPTAVFNYNLAARRSIRFNYRGNTQAPSVTQLQDVLDQSNPLNFRIGNPNLKQRFDNNVQLSYNTFNVNNFLYFNVNLNGSVISNNIVNTIDSIGKGDLRSLGLPDSFNTRGVLINRPVNLSGNYNVNLSSTLGIPLKKVASGKRSPMNLNLTTSLSYNQDASIVYKVKNFTYNTAASERVAFNYNIQDKLDLSTSARVNFNNTRYKFNSTRNNAITDSSRRYINYQYSAEATYTFLKLYSLNVDFDYFRNNGLAAGYNKGIPILNVYISRFLFRKRNGEIRLSANDVFNQNKSINRTSNNNVIQDTYTQVLSRFYLVTFAYNFNKFGGRSPQGNGNNRGNFNGGGNRGGNGGENNGFRNGGNGM